MARQQRRDRGASQRQLRVGELVRHELSDLFIRGGIQDPVIESAGVTVLEVTTSPDLKLATAYVRPFQPDANGEELVEALMRHRRFIRGELSPRLKLKFMPDIRFRLDTASDHASRIDRIMADPKVARDLDRPDDDQL
jgi:ribosome-binding factor A